MSQRAVTNKSASIRQRLLNLARASGRPFNEVAQHYALERWLYRLSRSEHAGRFVLKGALLLRAWHTPLGRPTRDIDLLAHTSNDLESVREAVVAVCEAPPSFADVWQAVIAFLRPVAEAIQHVQPFERDWTPGGPWLSRE